MRYLLFVLATFCAISVMAVVPLNVQAACNPPKDLTVNFVTSTSARVSWKRVNAAQSYTVQYAYAAVPTNWQDTTVSDTSFNLQPLAYGAVYVIQVRSNCANGSSAYGLSITFATQPKWEQTDLTFYHPDVNAKIGIGTSTPQASLDLRGNLVVQGTTGGVPVNGAGTRLEWVPNLGAFRAGAVTAAQWDANNIGQYSVAMGYNPKAKGNHSLAFGRGADATADYSAAIGRQSKASGENSYAIGSQAEATADGAVAIGANIQATAANSYALGYGAGETPVVNDQSGTIKLFNGRTEPALTIKAGQSFAYLPAEHPNTNGINDPQPPCTTHVTDMLGSLHLRMDQDCGGDLCIDRGLNVQYARVKKHLIVGEGDCDMSAQEPRALIMYSNPRGVNGQETEFHFRRRGAIPRYPHATYLMKFDKDDNLVISDDFTYVPTEGKLTVYTPSVAVEGNVNTAITAVLAGYGEYLYRGVLGAVNGAPGTEVMTLDGRGHLMVTYAPGVNENETKYFDCHIRGANNAAARRTANAFLLRNLDTQTWTVRGDGSQQTDYQVAGEFGVVNQAHLYDGTPEQRARTKVTQVVDDQTSRFTLWGSGKQETNYGITNDANMDIVQFIHLSGGAQAVNRRQTRVMHVEDDEGVKFRLWGDGSITSRGEIHSKAVEVRVTPNYVPPDYVFEPNYALMPLDSVRAFVQAHCHLPDVPSAAEMEVDGLNLGEMNLRLLKKVEELTLYLIEMRKELDTLKAAGK